MNLGVLEPTCPLCGREAGHGLPSCEETLRVRDGVILSPPQPEPPREAQQDLERAYDTILGLIEVAKTEEPQTALARVVIQRLRNVRDAVEAALLGAEAPQDKRPDRMFPVQYGPSIPWTLIAPHESQAKANHSQSLEQLAARGGISSCEAVAILEDRPWRQMNDELAKLTLRRLLLGAEAGPAEKPQCPHGENCACVISTRHEWFEGFCQERERVRVMKMAEAGPRTCGICGGTESADGDWYHVCGPCRWQGAGPREEKP